MEARIGKAVRDVDEVLKGEPLERVRDVMEEHLHDWEEIQALRDKVSSCNSYPDGDASSVFQDEPIFGEHNPPGLDDYLYHYTRLWTLPKMRKSQSLLFRPLREMNDPQESLGSFAFGMGLMGVPGEPLQLTSEEDGLFRRRDWPNEINTARGQVKIGSYSMDAFPDLSDIDPEHAEYAVPRRLAASRGYAHPRMWAQYADLGRGVCLVLNRDLLEGAVKESTSGIWPWGYGAITYRPIEHDLSLGFFDIRDLLQSGVSGALLKNFEESLLTKHADWAHEAEFRLFVMNGSPDPWLVPITTGVLAGLVLGPSFDVDRHLRYVRAFAETFGISDKVRMLHWTNGRAHAARVQTKRPRVARAVDPDVGTDLTREDRG